MDTCYICLMGELGPDRTMALLHLWDGMPVAVHLGGECYEQALRLQVAERAIQEAREAAAHPPR